MVIGNISIDFRTESRKSLPLFPYYLFNYPKIKTEIKNHS